ncbi:hypothetical protein SBOR_2284 [Sclerotinia borealis F-4128]|uniref:Uncharacterized protein n=1 Tax=Sclerotinia borealis (strain F-4128) TaxID=1432307 RepID=W9CNC6_SCLBF|nr:hypothetical protein SBOR_2284 [Sclerotinia borealis F-4128]
MLMYKVQGAPRIMPGSCRLFEIQEEKLEEFKEKCRESLEEYGKKKREMTGKGKGKKKKGRALENPHLALACKIMESLHTNEAGTPWLCLYIAKKKKKEDKRLSQPKSQSKPKEYSHLHQ